MAGGKKYNIWIAYSDLFTNLSTFLFVSALGMFAAIGSGLLAPPGWGGSSPCVIPTTIQTSMQAPDSLLQKAEFKVGAVRPQESCTEYYRIAGFRFPLSHSTVFASDDGVGATPEDFKKICTPLWLTLMRAEFERLDGRITFVGIAEPGPDDHYPASCGAFKHGPHIEGLPTTITTLETIRRCQGKDQLKAYRMCRTVINCLKSTASQRESGCRDVVAEYDRHRLWAANCAKNAALAQALQVYEKCEPAPDQWGFPDYNFDSLEMVQGAGRRDRRRLSWRRVGFDAISRDGLAQDLSADHPLAKAPAGSVLVRVQYGR
ncbi:MAG TPA: hypothetical protein VFZ91_02420 [Allosphingosinicella sp.]